MEGFSSRPRGVSSLLVSPKLCLSLNISVLATSPPWQEMSSWQPETIYGKYRRWMDCVCSVAVVDHRHFSVFSSCFSLYVGESLLEFELNCSAIVSCVDCSLEVLLLSSADVRVHQSEGSFFLLSWHKRHREKEGEQSKGVKKSLPSMDIEKRVSEWTTVQSLLYLCSKFSWESENLFNDEKSRMTPSQILFDRKERKFNFRLASLWHRDSPPWLKKNLPFCCYWSFSSRSLYRDQEEVMSPHDLTDCLWLFL